MNEFHRFPTAPREASLEEHVQVSFSPPTGDEPLDGFLADIGISLWLLREEQQPLRKSA